MSFNNYDYIENYYTYKDKGVLIPKGSIIIMPMANQTSDPDGFLRCDGRAVPSALYPDLYAVIGTNFGGNSTNFNLPNYESQFLYGKSNASGQMNQSIGNNNHTLTAGQLPSHNHSFTTIRHAHTGIVSGFGTQPYNDDFNNSGGGKKGLYRAGLQEIGDSYGIGADSATATISINNEGHSPPSSFSIVPLHKVMVFLIKY